MLSITDIPELVLWYLWSRNQKDIPQGIWAYETALDIHEHSDVMSSKIHMRLYLLIFADALNTKNPLLHHENLKEPDMEIKQRYKATTPIKTIIDIINLGNIADNFIIQALQRGLILKDELKSLKNTRLNTYKKIEGLLKW